MSKKAISAKEFREKYARRAWVPIPGTDQEIEVGRVDLLNLALAGDVSTATIEGFLSTIVTWQTMTAEEVAAFIRADNNLAMLAEIIEALVCAAAKQPAIVLEPQPADSDAIGIDELDFATKLAIIRALATLNGVPSGTQPTPDMTTGLSTH